MKNIFSTIFILGIGLFVICLVPGPVLAGLANGGFEEDFSGWTQPTDNGNASISSYALISGVEFIPYEGDKMAGLGYYNRSNYVWENSISQEILISELDSSLGFYYNFWTFDEAPFDNPGFLVEINGKTAFSIRAGEVGDDILGNLDYTGWQYFSIDLSEYYSPGPRQASVRISFAAGNTGDTDGTYASGVFLDGVALMPNTPVVPVPSSLLLMMAGLLGVTGLNRKKKG